MISGMMLNCQFCSTLQEHSLYLFSDVIAYFHEIVLKASSSKVSSLETAIQNNDQEYIILLRGVKIQFHNNYMVPLFHISSHPEFFSFYIEILMIFISPENLGPWMKTALLKQIRNLLKSVIHL